MGKQLSDLLGVFNFEDPKFNPRQVKPDMLSSKEVGPTTNNITIPAIGLDVQGVSLPYDRQYQKLTENFSQIYGVDSVRILTRGAVEPMQLAKRGVDRLSRIALGSTFGNNTRVGNFLRNQLNSFTNPQYPSDEVNNLPGTTPSTKNGLYGSLFNGGINNNKNAIGNLLTSFATPKQVTQNIGTIDSGGKVKIGGAAIDTALNVGFNALQGLGSTLGLNAKRGGGSSALSKVKNPLNSNDKNAPYYPSDYAKLSFGKSGGTLTGLATGQTQLMRDGETFYKKYEGANADKQLNTIKLDGKKYTSLKPSIVDFIKPNSLFKGYNTYDDGKGTSYILFDVENLSANEIYEKKFSKQVYKEYYGDKTGDYNDKNQINTKLFGGRVKRFNKTNDATGIEGAIGEDVSTVGNKNHRTLSSDALASYTPTKSDLVTIYIRDNASSEYIILMSNLTGISDTPTPTWGEAKPIGSPNKFYFYESFEREISFKGQLYAKTEVQIQKLWQKIEKLQQLTLATSGGDRGIIGKICELKIGDLVNSEFGFITNCTITIPDNSPWEIQTDVQVPFICEFDITYKVIQRNTSFNNISTTDIPVYEYLDFTLPGLDFSKKLQPGNTDITKLKGLGTFFAEAKGMEAIETIANQNTFTGGETSTNEVPTILNPEKWQITGTGEAPIGTGLLNSSGVDTTSTLEPFDESITMKILDDLPPLPLPKSSGGMVGGAPFEIKIAPDRGGYQQNQKKSSGGMLGGAPN